MPKPNQNGIEHKFIDLKELKVSDDSPGTIEGYRSVFAEIDEGGDVIIKGAFADCHDEYIHSGFSAHSHIWDFKDAVGYPLEAREDDYGWFVKSEFHTTQGAQDVRTIARERMKAGKQVGFSFGYKADDYQFIEQKDFKSQLPQFIKADRLEENLKKAQKFSRIRILKKVSAIEDSLVTAGMNKLAAATAVKSEGSEHLPEPAVMTKEELEELRKAVGAIDLPLAPLDHVWDSSATEKAVRELAKATDAPNADYAKSFLYVSGDGGDRFGDYALAFAGVADEKLLAVPKRIIAVAERLDAMEISDEAKTAIRTKIDGYYTAMRSEFKNETLIAPWAKTKTDPPADEPETVESLSAKIKDLTARLEAQGAENVEDKAGARNSSADKKKLQQIHDNATAMESTVCASASKGIVVSDQVKGMYEEALAEMTTPTIWQAYYAFLEVLDRIKDLPDTVGDATVDRMGLVEEALQAMVTAMREAAQANLAEPEVEYVFYGAAPESFKTLSSDLVSEPFDVHNLAVVTAVREIATRSGAIKMAVEALIDRANEKQEFRNADGRPVSALIRARKADIDKGLKDARENIAEAVEKSESLTLLEPEDLSAQMRAQMLVTQRLRLNAPA